MLTAGVDVGSTTAKAVVFDGEILGWAVEPTRGSPRRAARLALDGARERAGLAVGEIAKVVATGYGRKTLDFADKEVSEITCHARGAALVVPGTQLVIDVGGQDSKAILIAPGGRVSRFVMNDKCAAGTGRFLEATLNSLGLALNSLPDLEGVGPVELNSTCTVFVESEVVGLLAREVPLEQVVAGLFKAMAGRAAVMAGRLGSYERVTFTGGVAKFVAMRTALARALGAEIAVPPEPQITGALGAALVAQSA